MCFLLKSPCARHFRQIIQVTDFRLNLCLPLRSYFRVKLSHPRLGSTRPRSWTFFIQELWPKWKIGSKVDRRFFYGLLMYTQGFVIKWHVILHNFFFLNSGIETSYKVSSSGSFIKHPRPICFIWMVKSWWKHELHN